jgi:ribosomal protein L7Ae-like RNA K-turn-binding protein
MVTVKLEERIASYIALANKAGKVVSGSDSVDDSIRKQKAGLVILASDVSADIGQKVIRLAARFSVPCYQVLSRDQLAGLLGKGLRSAVAIASGGFVEAVTRELERFRNFSEEGRTNE